MPIQDTPYSPPLLFRNGHIATIYAGLFRRVKGLVQERERIGLPDGDFLDLDWSYSGRETQSVVVLLHGLEGHGQRPYITGSARILNKSGYDACAVNFRGCSGETNDLFRSYHSGATEDLEAVLHHIVNLDKYQNIYIKGFSLGGNLALKFLGEGRKIPQEVKAATAVSVPCDLHDSLIQLLKPKNLLYARRFRNHLVAKLWLKHEKFPDRITSDEIRAVQNLKDFDDIYTSKAHGFKDALDYYKQCSSLQFLPGIRVPTLIINARNDSFLGAQCYPIKEAHENHAIYLNMPVFGGHVGFYGPDNISYTEKEGLNFFKEKG